MTTQIKLQAVIIDDEADGRLNLQHAITEVTDRVNVVSMFEDLEQAKSYIENNLVDLLFLDINMPQMNGFEFLDSLDEIPFEVIFVTAYDEYAIKAFKYSAFDYVLKPISNDELDVTLSKILKQFEDEVSIQTSVKLQNHQINEQYELPKKLVIPSLGKFHVKAIDEITHLEADGSYTKFHFLNNESLMVGVLLREYQELLQSYGFIRVHHSILVNLNLIEEVNSKNHEIQLVNGNELPVSYRKKNDLIKALKSHFIQKSSNAPDS